MTTDVVTRMRRSSFEEYRALVHAIADLPEGSVWPIEPDRLRILLFDLRISDSDVISHDSARLRLRRQAIADRAAASTEIDQAKQLRAEFDKALIEHRAWCASMNAEYKSREAAMGEMDRSSGLALANAKSRYDSANNVLANTAATQDSTCYSDPDNSRLSVKAEPDVQSAFRPTPEEPVYTDSFGIGPGRH
jgi:hypothetical protein